MEYAKNRFPCERKNTIFARDSLPWQHPCWVRLVKSSSGLFIRLYLNQASKFGLGILTVLFKDVVESIW